MGFYLVNKHLIKWRIYQYSIEIKLPLFCSRLSSIATAEIKTSSLDNVDWFGENGSRVSSLQRLLQRCGIKRDFMAGKVCHARTILEGLQDDTLTSNILINMYSKCGSVDSAGKVFEFMPERSLVSWNTMIMSLTQNGEEGEAMKCFVKMQREGSPFSEYTLSGVLCSCAMKYSLSECRQLQVFAIKASMNSNKFVATALLDIYAKCGLMKEANLVFSFMHERSAVTWSSMMAGFVQNEAYEEALVLFHRAQVIGLQNDAYVISSAICACAGLGALIEGNQINALVSKIGFRSNIFIATSLVDMYAKSGGIRDAYNVFREIGEKNIVLWNAMISGFSKHARPFEAMILFEKMQQMGMYPNDVTYVGIFSACSHVGLVKEAQKYFEMMTTKHDVSPNILHYGCMVDILGRAGRILEAYELIEKMPFDGTISMWGSLLASCRVHGKSLEIAQIAAKHLFEKEPYNAGNYILLSDVYAANRKWEEVAMARKRLKENGTKKETGKSWIEIKNRVHSFMVGERNHPNISEVYEKLDVLVEELKKRDYRPETEDDLHNIEDESKKKQLLVHHSEKLALAMGLLYLPTNAPIRIMKNLRICRDCHTFMKLSSSFTGRNIVVRDISRFHHFDNGECSCRDFW